MLDITYIVWIVDTFGCMAAITIPLLYWIFKPIIH